MPPAFALSQDQTLRFIRILSYANKLTLLKTLTQKSVKDMQAKYSLRLLKTLNIIAPQKALQPIRHQHIPFSSYTIVNEQNRKTHQKWALQSNPHKATSQELSSSSLRECPSTEISHASQPISLKIIQKNLANNKNNRLSRPYTLNNHNPAQYIQISDSAKKQNHNHNK